MNNLISPSVGATAPTFSEFYGNWIAVVVVAGFFGLFVWGLMRPRRSVEWRRMGLTQAFIVALFVEMYGLPLTLFLIAPLLGLSVEVFGFQESHLWAFFVSRWTPIELEAAVHWVQVASNVLVRVGMVLVALAWWQVWRAKGQLVQSGIYRVVRHPQYVGLIILLTGFVIQWPTLLTVVMFPFLVITYVRLAAQEDAELAKRHGKEFEQYRDSVRGFVPIPIGSNSSSRAKIPTRTGNRPAKRGQR